MVHVPTDVMALNPGGEVPTFAEIRRHAINAALISLGWLSKEDEGMCIDLRERVDDAIESLMDIDDEMLECEEE